MVLLFFLLCLDRFWYVLVWSRNGLDRFCYVFMLSKATSEGLGSIYLNINRIGIDSRLNGFCGLLGCRFLGCGPWGCGTSISQCACSIARRCRIDINGSFYYVAGLGRCFAINNEVLGLSEYGCESRRIACSQITCRIVRCRQFDLTFLPLTAHILHLIE